jgi:hypothetical protein
MSRRGFFKTLGKGAAITTVAPSVLGATASQSTQYMRVPYDPHGAIDSFTRPLSKYAMEVAEPFVGAVPAASAATTSSGIIVTPTEVLIPNELFQSLNTALTAATSYMRKMPGTQAILNDVGAQQAYRNFLNSANILSRNMKEISNKYSVAIDTHLPKYADHVDRNFDDDLQRLKAEAEEKEKAEKARDNFEKRKNKEKTKYGADKDHWSRSRMDYAGGSEDVQGEDYTTLESLTTKIIGLPIDSVVENENDTKYWLVTRKPNTMLLGPESVKAATPKEYFGNSMAASILGSDSLNFGSSVTTPSGMVLIDRNRLLVPDALFQQMSDFNKLENEVRVAEYELSQLSVAPESSLP